MFSKSLCYKMNKSPAKKSSLIPSSEDLASISKNYGFLSACVIIPSYHFSSPGLLFYFQKPGSMQDFSLLVYCFVCPFNSFKGTLQTFIFYFCPAPHQCFILCCVKSLTSGAILWSCNSVLSLTWLEYALTFGLKCTIQMTIFCCFTYCEIICTLQNY